VTTLIGGLMADAARPALSVPVALAVAIVQVAQATGLRLHMLKARCYSLFGWLVRVKLAA
jgi:hypothetical protein